MLRLLAVLCVAGGFSFTSYGLLRQAFARPRGIEWKVRAAGFQNREQADEHFHRATEAKANQRF